MIKQNAVGEIDISIQIGLMTEILQSNDTYRRIISYAYHNETTPKGLTMFRTGRIFSFSVKFQNW